MYDDDRIQGLEAELANFVAIVKRTRPEPSSVPALPGIDIFGDSLPLHAAVGGDYLSFIDFKVHFDLDARIASARASSRPEMAEMLHRNKRRAGVLLADVAGHQATDSVMGCMLHEAFFTGALYELELFGEITPKLFDNINRRFYRCSEPQPKLITMIYGEIADSGTFRFLSAGHPAPLVFSREYGRFVPLDRELLVNSPPIGLQRSEGQNEGICSFCPFECKQKYHVNELRLMNRDDILLLHTDGLSEHADGRYFPAQLEKVILKAQKLPARNIYEAVIDDLNRFAQPEDDISLVVIKRT